jgi:hypothetical protein
MQACTLDCRLALANKFDIKFGAEFLQISFFPRLAGAREKNNDNKKK